VDPARREQLERGKRVQPSLGVDRAVIDEVRRAIEVRIKCWGKKPDGTIVVEFERTAMFLKRSQIEG
jgi:hypothetical protein